MAIKKTKLNLDKFKTLLARNGYGIGVVYVENGDIRFLECRTPLYQKTFMVKVPEKYRLSATDTTGTTDPAKARGEGDDFETIDVELSDELPSSRQVDYIMSTRGNTLSCSLVSVSSDGICSCMEGCEAEKYVVADRQQARGNEDSMSADNDIPTPEAQSTDPVSNAVNSLKKMDPNFSLPEPGDGDGAAVEEVADNEEVAVDIATDDDGIMELAFEDEDGNEVDEVTEALRGISNRDEVKGDLFDEHISGTYEDAELGIDNSIPTDIYDEELTLGIVYILIDINSLFRKIKDYEDEVIKTYSEIYKNERQTRIQRLKDIGEQLETLKSKSKTRLFEIEAEEKRLGVQLVKLTVVLKESNSQLKKVKANKNKFGDDLFNEVLTINSETLTAVKDLNLELSRLKETADEILHDYESTLGELDKL